MTCFRFIFTVALRLALPSEGLLSLKHGEESSCATSDCQRFSKGMRSRSLFEASEVAGAPWAVVMLQHFATQSGSPKETFGKELRNLPEKSNLSRPSEATHQPVPIAEGLFEGTHGSSLHERGTENESKASSLYRAAAGCGSQHNNFGDIATPDLCAQQVVAYPGCGPQFMFSNYTSWGCRCCAIEGADGGAPNPNWYLYTARGWEAEPVGPFVPIYQCHDEQIHNSYLSSDASCGRNRRDDALYIVTDEVNKIENIYQCFHQVQQNAYLSSDPSCGGNPRGKPYKVGQISQWPINPDDKLVYQCFDQKSQNSFLNFDDSCDPYLQNNALRRVGYITQTIQAPLPEAFVKGEPALLPALAPAKQMAAPVAAQAPCDQTCEPAVAPWTQKCTWGMCKGCSTCGTVCPKWCTDHNLSWEFKIQWKGCEPCRNYVEQLLTSTKPLP